VIRFVHYDDSLTPVEIIDIPDTPMMGLGNGKYVFFQDIDEAIFKRDQVYYARIRGTHPVQGHEELSEQQFKAVFAGTTGLLTREHFQEGDKRAFVVDYRDSGTREPLDMLNVTVEIVYYDDALTPTEQFALLPTPMVSLGDGRYVFLLMIDDAFPPNTEFFVRYRGTHPIDGTEELVQEEFSSFESTVVDDGLKLFPIEPF
jgi:hypothetical protein